MKVLMSKGWLKNKIDELGDDEPSGIIACNPTLYKAMEEDMKRMLDEEHKAIIVGEASSTALHLVTVAGDNMDFTDDGMERYTWALDRAVRYIQRMSRSYDPSNPIENQ